MVGSVFAELLGDGNPSVAVPLYAVGNVRREFTAGLQPETIYPLMALTISTGFVVDDRVVVHRK